MTTRTKWLATASLLALVAGGWAFWRWMDFSQPDLLGTFPAGVTGGYTVMAFSSDNSILAVNGQTGTLIDLEMGVRRFLPSGGGIRSVLFPPGGNAVVTVDQRGLVQLWDTRNFSELSQFQQSVAPYVIWATLSPDGNQLLCNGNTLDETAVWDLDSGELVTTFGGRGSIAVPSTYSPDGRFVATMGKLWTAPEFSEHVTLDGGGRSATFSPDGKTLATCDSDTIQLWEVSSGSLLNKLKGRAGKMYSLAFSPDGRTLAAGSGEDDNLFSQGAGKVELWDMASGKVVSRWTAWKSLWVTRVAFSPDGTFLATANVNGDVKVWGIENVVRVEKVPVPARE